jgi:hypothetical protein
MLRAATGLTKRFGGVAALSDTQPADAGGRCHTHGPRRLAGTLDEARMELRTRTTRERAVGAILGSSEATGDALVRA